MVDAADGVDPAGPLVQVQEQLGHDLAEAERDDRQVVATKPQGWEAEDGAERGGNEHPDEKHQPERKVVGVVQGRRSQLE